MTTTSIIVNGVEYVPAPTPIDPNYVIIRSRDAGVFAGDLETADLATATVVLRDARRLWYWDGAATLSQLAIDGVSKPASCKFPAAVPSITILGVCEIISATEVCRQSIAGVASWRV